MSKEILMFINTKIEKNELYCHITSILVGDVDIEKVLGSN